jgi:hypothetical protein
MTASGSRDRLSRPQPDLLSCPKIAVLAPCPSLRAKQGNPGAPVRPTGLLAPCVPRPWIASSQGLLAMTDGGAADPIDSVVIGRRITARESDRALGRVRIRPPDRSAAMFYHRESPAGPARTRGSSLEKSDFPHRKPPSSLGRCRRPLLCVANSARRAQHEDTLCCKIKITSIQIDSSDDGPLSSPITSVRFP